MTDQHPITPPPELVEQWIAEIWHEGTPVRVAASDIHIATQAARWGADQELEWCVSYVDNSVSGNKARALRAARRPKPPSLKEQALEALDEEQAELSIQNYKLIRAVLEALPND